MKYLILSAVLVGLVSAQSLAGLPLCAYSCVEAAYPASCNGDPKCICSASNFIANVTCCVSTACDEADQQATIKYAGTICDPVGVNITQTAATCAATATGAAGTGTSTGSVSTTPGTTSVTSSVVSSANGAVGTSASATPSAAKSSGGAGQLLVQLGGGGFVAIMAAAALL